MKFPDKSHVNAPHYYCYPINIKEEGDFLLTGCGQGHDKVTAGVPDEHNLLHQLENIAITFDKKVTPKEFRIENNANGEPEVVLTRVQKRCRCTDRKLAGLQLHWAVISPTQSTSHLNTNT